MNKTLKRALLGAVALIVVGGGAAGAFVAKNVSATNKGLAKQYDLPTPTMARSTDPAVLARGKHLTETIGSCATRDCHGTDLGGGNVLKMGPVGTFTAPNITSNGVAAVYTDGELLRLLRHGVKRDNRTVVFMPVQDFSWMPQSDREAIVSYLRTVPPVERSNGGTAAGIIGKVLDQNNQFIVDVARRIDHGKDEVVPAPEPTAAYGKFIARLCAGCHGEGFSGGKMPGAPSSVPIPSNLTPHATGLGGWTFAEFDKTCTTGVNKSGKKLDSFMPPSLLAAMDGTERKAIFEFLQKLPPREKGNR